MKQSILIAEDEADIREILKLYLESEGFEIIEAADGQEALSLAESYSPDMAILDVMMPKMDGFELTRRLREKSNLPILILSAKGQDNDKILGLNLGADDYIAKPFNALEIVARVKAQLRRAAKVPTTTITIGDLTLDTAQCSLTKKGEYIFLTPTEYKLLAAMMHSPGRIFTKAQLYEAVSGEFFESSDNTMMVHISKLRDKIEDDPKNPAYVVTIRGLGYKFEKKK